MPKREKGYIYLEDVMKGWKTYEQYMANCYERNEKVKCHRELNAFPLCGACPKAKGTKYEKLPKQKEN